MRGGRGYLSGKEKIMPTLADIYSAIGSAKRNAADFVQNPGTSLQQMVGYANDRARAFNQQGDTAAAEFQQTQRLKGPQQMQLAQQIAEGYNPTGMTVWHGSPYKFKAFDASKIGTGEGAQAYGHGLYVAENPEVAKGYQKTLSKDVFNVGGEVFDPNKLQHLNVKVLASKGKLDDAIKKATEISYGNSPSASLAAQDLSILKDVKSKGGLNPHEGSIYKIDLPDKHIDTMLDWDKPLSQQPKNVQDAMKGISKEFPSIPGFDLQKWMNTDPLASTWHNVINRDLGVNQPEIASILANKGVSGIKYLDQVSRDAEQGTRNFVIFPGNEHLLDILDINGNPIQ